MPDQSDDTVEHIGGFEMQGMMMRYSLFVPRLYNWCKSLGFELGKIMPSRAFCSDESQGYPIILLAKHFGTFPFNHGRVGGIVAADRNGPHADHGQDLVIIQASHVGYDPDSKQFGIYRRLQTEGLRCGPSCGKIHHVLDWYLEEYNFAKQNIFLHRYEGKACIIIDNQLLHGDRDEGLLLNLRKLLSTDSDGQCVQLKRLSTSKVFSASESIVKKFGIKAFNSTAPTAIGDKLSAELFFFRRDISVMDEGGHHLERNLIRYMPQIITDSKPMLIAAQITSQIEFDHTFRSIVRDNSYQGKRVLFVSGLHIDISPEKGQLFPLTKFVPWAAYLQEKDGSYKTIEQAALLDELNAQSTDNPDQIDLEQAIQIMAEVKEVKVEL